MNLSNTSGGGRGSDKGSIIGDVICHGKKHLWMKGQGKHYHHGMKAGENTLDTLICRLLMVTMAQNFGNFSSKKFLDAYIKFMTTPNSHNDTYAATAHRMFFANWVNNVPADKCADNDGHNTDSIDGLINQIPLAVRKAIAGEEINVHEVINTLRKSNKQPKYGVIYVDQLVDLLRGENLRKSIKKAAQKIGFDVEAVANQKGDPMVACYIDSSFPAMLHFAYKYNDDIKTALLAGANAGGENVNRNALLGAVMGAAHGFENIDKSQIKGLSDWNNIEKDIDVFMKSLEVSNDL